MSLSVPGMLLGSLTALSGTLAVRSLLPQRTPLDQVLRRTHAPAPRSPSPQVAATVPARWAERVGARLMESDAFVTRLPARDLNLLEMAPASLLGRCALYALSGFLIPQWINLLLRVGGLSLPFVVPAAAGLSVALFMVFKCLDDVRDKATGARLEYRYYIASVLERVALARNSDAGAAEALARAVESGDGRAAVRIRDTVEHAQLAGVSPWDALGGLGSELGVPDIARLSASLSLAGEEQAAVYDQLEAQAEVVRRGLLSDRKEQANVATEKMHVPSLAIVFLLAVFLLTPALVRILAL
ncbi:tight adherence protein C [Streptomyces sp. SAI-208]|uniref:type II secretion system F family protein n=1 Tax=Streptomyces sp. SAI-208 TaxID=2940550 RepID=UPI0024751FDA|nr:type II secretion system F family protein [Streptomyces sp. SAI-208]MDH6604419.1 tight adherence protein C [Streptomyces sp. SAI-208]